MDTNTVVNEKQNNSEQENSTKSNHEMNKKITENIIKDITAILCGVVR